MWLKGGRGSKNKNISGYKLVFNVGRDGGQVIDHLHLHLLAGGKVELLKYANIQWLRMIQINYNIR